MGWGFMRPCTFSFHAHAPIKLVAVDLHPLLLLPFIFPSSFLRLAIRAALAFHSATLFGRLVVTFPAFSAIHITVTPASLLEPVLSSLPRPSLVISPSIWSPFRSSGN